MILYGSSREPGSPPRTRVGFLDEARGLCIILMVLYHGAYDIIYLFGWDIPLFHSALLRFAQPFVAGIFILISGIACRYSRNNLRRGLVTLALGMIMSAFTIFFMPEQAIYFGILHLLGSCMTIFGLARRAADRIPPVPGIILCLLLFTVTFNAPAGYIGLPGVPLWHIPAGWTDLRALIPLGFAASGADYFPLLPWLFLFFAGCYLGAPFAANDMPPFFYRNRSRFLSFVGRHTIYVYLLHQPVIYGLLTLFFRISGLAG